MDEELTAEERAQLPDWVCLDDDPEASYTGIERMDDPDAHHSHGYCLKCEDELQAKLAALAKITELNVAREALDALVLVLAQRDARIKELEALIAAKPGA